MANASKVHYGLEGLHVFFVDSDAESGYEAAIAIPGVVSFNRTAQVNTQSFYADNIRYFYATDDQGDEGELETAGIPNAVLARMLGWMVDQNGVLVRTTDGVSEEFGIAFQVEGDDAKRRKQYFSCKATVPDESNSTKGENLEIQTETLKIVMSPVTRGNHKVVAAVADEDSSATKYASFLTTMYTPVETGA